MANVKFLIRFPEQEQTQTIYVSYRFGRNDKLLYALPLKTEAIFWDADRQRVKNSKYCTYTDEVNAAIIAISAKVETYITDSARDGRTVTKDRLKELLDNHFGKGKPTAADFHKFFEAYIAECDTRMNGRRGGQNVTYKTKREYARTLEYIQQYEKKNKVHLNFADIDQGFITSFVGFLQSLNLATNTIAHKVISLKALMRAAVERELTDNERWKYYKNATEDTEAVALTEEELEKIRTCDLSYNPHLAEIRDLFLLGCWTGLRFSDVIRLRPEHIQDDMIVIQQQKTNNYVTIPIHPVFREIWERYGGIPLTISNQKFNDHIKEVCKAAGITDSVLKSITRGGKKVTTKYEKWQLVSSHTGRRSFATNLYKSGFPSISIMQITGHKTEAAFLKYIKVTPQEHAKLLMQHWKESK
ncbi:MAG: site-specific integrase [Prevotella sp.]|nr:site-specific integrase [Prevotella sp.]